jgi:hypothetical protein
MCDIFFGRQIDRVGASSLHISTRSWKIALAVLLFLTALSANLWIVSRYGNSTPFGDQWDGEAAGLYVPFFDSKLTISHLLAAHNEHRIFTTRLLALTLIELNGMWDPVLQMMVNAIIRVAAGVFLLLALRNELDIRTYAGLAILVLIVTAVPFAPESTLLGFQTHFYFVLLFGLIAIWLIGREKSFSWKWSMGFAASTLCFLSLASGGLVFLSSFLIILTKLVLRIERNRREWLGAALLLAALAVALLTTPAIEAHAQLKAHSASEFLHAFFVLAAWPLGGMKPAINYGRNILVAVVIYIPTVFLMLSTVRSRPASNCIVWAILGAAFWVPLQLAAIAYGRALVVGAPRYRDIAAVGLLVNFVCAALLGRAASQKFVAGVWAILVMVGLVLYAARVVPPELKAYHEMSLAQEQNVKSFLTTGAFAPGANEFPKTLPYPNSDRLAGLLSDEKVRRFLPSNLQMALPAGVGRSRVEVRTDRLGGIRDFFLEWSGTVSIVGVLLFVVALFPMFINRQHQCVDRLQSSSAT